jgi:AcrR family transcriptional regulator
MEYVTQRKRRDITEMTMTDSETTRRNIMETARFLFQEQGYDQTTLKDIADRLNQSETTIAGYFASKDDLLEAIWSE